MRSELFWHKHYQYIVFAAKNYMSQKWSLNVLFFLLSFTVLSQNEGSIKVQLADKTNPKEVLPFANVIVYKDSFEVARAITDINGYALIKHLFPGTYHVKAVYVGYQSKQINGVLVEKNKMTHLTIYISNEGMELREVTIVNYSTPLIDANTVSGGTVERQQFQMMADKSINSVVSTQAGVYQTNSTLNVRGSRGTSNVFIDGERVIGTSNIPQQAVEQTSIMLGGLPAQYGNVMDGVILAPDIISYQAVPKPVVPDIPINQEEYGVFIENGFSAVGSAPLSTFAIDVDGASYSNTHRMLTQGYLPPKDAVRIEEFVNYFKYNYPKVSGENPFSIFTEYADCPWNKAHQLLQVALKGKDIDEMLSVPNHLVFLIDVSGSMSSEDKLPLLKRAFKLLVKQLRPQDKISIVVYAGSSGKILESEDGDNKETILNALDQLEAGGSTAGGEGINLAYKIAEKHFLKNGNNRVILATDGDFNVGVSGDKELEDLIIEKRGKGIYLSVLGFGEGNIKDSKMEILADKGNGNYYYIDNFLEARKVLVSQFGGTMYAIAKDVKIQVEFNPARVKEYRLIGYDNRLLSAQDFNDDKKDAGELGAGHCVTALYEIIPTGSTEGIAKIDELKYTKANSDNMDELATVKFRYKGVKKDDTLSKLITHVVPAKISAPAEVSENLKLAAGICEFAMLLKDSEYKGASSFKEAVELVKNFKDTEGYVAGLMEMMNIAQEIKPVVASKK